MAQLTVNVPDTLVPRLTAALVARYPELAGGTSLQIGRGGIRALLREMLATQEAAVAQVSGAQTLTTQVEAARAQAMADTESIT